MPFGIAQIGKAFRNEITPRNFIFRSREFEQMEIEYFVRGETWEAAHDEWQKKSMAWLVSIGLRPELVRLRVRVGVRVRGLGLGLGLTLTLTLTL